VILLVPRVVDEGVFTAIPKILLLDVCSIPSFAFPIFIALAYPAFKLCHVSGALACRCRGVPGSQEEYGLRRGACKGPILRNVGT
jgi:hypothetical protein